MRSEVVQRAVDVVVPVAAAQRVVEGRQCQQLAPVVGALGQCHLDLGPVDAALHPAPLAAPHRAQPHGGLAAGAVDVRRRNVVREPQGERGGVGVAGIPLVEAGQQAVEPGAPGGLGRLAGAVAPGDERATEVEGERGAVLALVGDRAGAERVDVDDVACPGGLQVHEVGPPRRAPHLRPGLHLVRGQLGDLDRLDLPLAVAEGALEGLGAEAAREHVGDTETEEDHVASMLPAGTDGSGPSSTGSREGRVGLIGSVRSYVASRCGVLEDSVEVAGDVALEAASDLAGVLAFGGASCRCSRGWSGRGVGG